MNTHAKDSIPRNLSWVDYADSIRRGAWPEHIGADRYPAIRVDVGATVAAKKEQGKPGTAPGSARRPQ